MKTTKFLTYCLIAAMLFTVSSCSKTDKCGSVTCQNGGTCNDGSCNCAAGYEGTNCETKANAKFAGIYSGTMTFNGTAHASDLVVAPYTTAGSIIITDSTIAFESKVSGTALTINSRGVIAGDTVQITGSGNLTNSNTLSFTITAVDGPDSITVLYQGTK